MDIWKYCSCNASAICPFCKMLMVITLAALAGIFGYLLGKRKGNKKG
jgi:hypothetical protein